MKKEKINQHEFLSPQECGIDLSNALVINGKSLEPRPVNTSVPVERKFKSEKEFNELVVHNSKMLFGKDTILMDATKSPLECYVLIDYREADKHVLHFVDIALSKQNFWDLFARITRLFIVAQPPFTVGVVKVRLLSRNRLRFRIPQNHYQCHNLRHRNEKYFL
jgi:hypothetical protein